MEKVCGCLEKNVCVYLGDVCGGGCAQRLRGDGLGGHQNARLSVPTTVQLGFTHTHTHTHWRFPSFQEGIKEFITIASAVTRALERHFKVPLSSTPHTHIHTHTHTYTHTHSVIYTGLKKKTE